jgi:hypothetical protein
MRRAAILGCALIIPPLFTSAFTGQLEPLDFHAQNIISMNAQIPLGHHDDYHLVCHGISRNISSASQVFSLGVVSAWFIVHNFLCRASDTPQFTEDIAHWLNSSSQISACSVRPGTAEDLGLIVSDPADTPSLILMC